MIEKKTKTVWLRPVLYAAASVCALFISVTVYQHFTAQTVENTTEQVAVYSEDSFDEAADYVMIDNQDIYACLAGYVEAGETIENAVRREIFEETGIRVRNIQYRGSQSWPFPQQLMLGFYADYESGEITCQKEEIEDARWFDPDNLTVATPAPGSIAYKLIHGKI